MQKKENTTKDPFVSEFTENDIAKWRDELKELKESIHLKEDLTIIKGFLFTEISLKTNNEDGLFLSFEALCKSINEKKFTVREYRIYGVTTGVIRYFQDNAEMPSFVEILCDEIQYHKRPYVPIDVYSIRTIDREKKTILSQCDIINM